MMLNITKQKIVENKNQSRLTPLIIRFMAAIVAVFFLLSVHSSFAETGRFNFNKKIDVLKTAKKVTVALYNPRAIRFENERYENDNLLRMRMNGCNFANRDQEDAAVLVRLLKQYRIRPSSYNYLPYASLVIYFSYADGQDGQIVLGRRYLNESSVDGEMRLPPDYEPVKVVIDQGVYPAIYGWISKSSVWELFPETEQHKRYQPLEQSNEYCKDTMSLAPNYFRHNQQQTCARSWIGLLANECPSGWMPLKLK